MTQEKPTDAQLVALAERLDFTFRYDDMLIAPPGSDDPADLRPVTHLLTWEGAGAIQAAMAGLGYTRFAVGWIEEEKRWFAHFFVAGQSNYGGKHTRHGYTGPDAIVLAACAALGVGE